MLHLLDVYLAKKELATAHDAFEQQRAHQEAYVRNLKIQIDGFPSRRNSLQQEVYQEWLMARNQLTELDRQLNDLRSQVKQVDEAVLARAELDGKAPGPNNRRDILIRFPSIQRECLNVFGSLKEADAEVAKDNGVNRDQVLNRAMVSLGRPDELEIQYGSTREFLDAFKQYCRGRRSFDPSKPMGKQKGKPRGRR